MEAPCSRSKECTWNSCDVRRFQTRVSFGRPRRRIFATESIPKLFVVSLIIFARLEMMMMMTKMMMTREPDLVCCFLDHHSESSFSLMMTTSEVVITTFF